MRLPPFMPLHTLRSALKPSDLNRSFHLHSVIVAAMLIGLGSFSIQTQRVHGSEPLSFNRDIRPILSDNCFQCHGPDDKQRHGGLRLDKREAAIAPSDSGAIAIVPSDLNASEMVARIVSADPDKVMPPTESGKKLTVQQIELLRRWVAEGANYEGHWAFTPVARPAVPVQEGHAWPKNEIDHFVLQEMVKQNLHPSAEASKEILIRRVSLDLIGLPPTLEEVDAFLADNSPESYERMVDRLLTSERYGERMAQQWLDFARYADSNGFQVDSSRYQWPWRDWVIEAFNKNMPFDQFTLEQVAGDMLPDATLSQQVATGFNRNHRLNGEGGIIAEEWRVETVIDRVETTGLTWLGLTFNCCRCHDHKYDPITQKEFYQFYAFFNNVTESGTLQGESKNTDPTIQVLNREHEMEIANRNSSIEKLRSELTAARSEIRKHTIAWEPTLREQIKSSATMWRIVDPKQVISTQGTTLTKQPDGSYLASGANPTHDTYEIATEVAGGDLSGILLECFIDPSLPEQSLGRYSNGNFVLGKVEIEVRAKQPDGTLASESRKLEIAHAVADFSQKDWDISNVLKNGNGKGWAVDGPTRKENRRAAFLTDHPVKIEQPSLVTIRLVQNVLGGHNIGRFRVSLTGLPPTAVTLDGAQFPEEVKLALAAEHGSRSDAQWKALEEFYAANADGPIRRVETELKKQEKELESFRQNLPTVMVMKEGKPRDAFLLIRGQYDKRGDKVEMGLPLALPPMPEGEPINRLGLARWLIAPSNPLTPRVWVNRAWERFFGTGIVKTSENFGSQADFPSHPALLDWLAAEFVNPTTLPAVAGVPAQPWDMKAVQKKILMSATYRQASKASLESIERDPENRWLSHGPRFRLSAEQLRDQSLMVSGLLVNKLGGPSVRPYMPEGVWDETSRYGDLRNYMHDKGDGLYRRTLYTVWKRTAAPPSMLIFDAPSREICTVKRSRTNTPLQALALLNEVTYVEAAKKLGERMLKSPGASAREKIQWGFRVVTGRNASDRELDILVRGFEADLAWQQDHPEESQKLISVGESTVEPQVSPSELATFALTANVLLNLDEVVTRE